MQDSFNSIPCKLMKFDGLINGPFFRGYVKFRVGYCCLDVLKVPWHDVQNHGVFRKQVGRVVS